MWVALIQSLEDLRRNKFPKQEEIQLEDCNVETLCGEIGSSYAQDPHLTQNYLLM